MSGGDASALLDNPSLIQTDGLLEILTEISQKLDGLTTLLLRITDQFDLFLAIGVTVIISVVAYVILYKFTRF